MIKKLRIIFTILSAICIAGILPIGAIFGFTWAFLAVFGAGLFYLLMMICKKRQELAKGRSLDEPDFFHPQENPSNKDE